MLVQGDAGDELEVLEFDFRIEQDSSSSVGFFKKFNRSTEFVTVRYMAIA